MKTNKTYEILDMISRNEITGWGVTSNVQNVDDYFGADSREGLEGTWLYLYLDEFCLDEEDVQHFLKGYKADKCYKVDERENAYVALFKF